MPRGANSLLSIDPCSQNKCILWNFLLWMEKARLNIPSKVYNQNLSIFTLSANSESCGNLDSLNIRWDIEHQEFSSQNEGYMTVTIHKFHKQVLDLISCTQDTIENENGNATWQINCWNFISQNIHTILQLSTKS